MKTIKINKYYFKIKVKTKKYIYKKKYKLIQNINKNYNSISILLK